MADARPGRGEALMVAYNCQPRFIEPILAGTKGGTIRAARKTHIPANLRPGGHALPGEWMQLYTGMRTRHCRLISTRHCIDSEPIVISFARQSILLLDHGPIDRPDALDDFARFDGFASFDEMRAFWLTDLFLGWHIRWLPLPDGCCPGLDDGAGA